MSLDFLAPLEYADNLNYTNSTLIDQVMQCFENVLLKHPFRCFYLYRNLRKVLSGIELNPVSKRNQVYQRVLT